MNKIYTSLRQRNANKFLSSVLLLLSFVAIITTANAQTKLVSWDVAGITNYGVSPFSPTTSNPNLENVVGLTRGAGLSAGTGGVTGGWGATNWAFTQANAITDDDVIYFGFKPKAGFAISLATIDPFSYRRSGTGPVEGRIQYTIDGGTNYSGISHGPIAFGSSSTSGAGVTPTISVNTDADLQQTSSQIGFRIVPFGATNTAGTFYIFDVNSSGDDFTVNGRILGSETLALSGFTTFVGFESTSQSFNVKGDGLTSANVTLTAPAGFEISSDDITFNSSITVTPTLGSVNATVYVRIASTTAVGSQSGNLTIVGGGFTSGADLKVALSGDVNPLPVANITQNTNFLTIQEAIDDANNGDLIEVAAGTYDEQVIVNKELTINGVGATKPIVNFTGTVAGRTTLFDIVANNVTINNFQFDVDMSKLHSAILASAAGLTKITVTDNDILPYHSVTNTYVSGYGNRNAININHGSYRIGGVDVNDITVTGNKVAATVSGPFLGDGAGDIAFRAAASVDAGAGTFSNNDFQSINHDLILRFNSTDGVTIDNNMFKGGGVQLSDQNAGAGTFNVTNNTFDGSTTGSVMRLQNNQNGRTTVVSGNTFNNLRWGVSLENYKNVSFDNNTFNALADETDFNHIVVNTKSNSSNSNTIVQTAIDGSFTNNTFNGLPSNVGTAMLFLNQDSDNAAFGAFTLGTAGNENTFNSGFANFIKLGNETGSSASSTFPTYPGTGGWVTSMACWSADLGAIFNKFDVGSGAKLAADLTAAERTNLEDKIFHKPDVACLATVEYFLPIKNITQSIAYSTIGQAIAAANSDDVIEVSQGSYNERVVIDKPLTLQGFDSDETLYVIDGTGLSGNGDGIQLANGVKNVTIKQLTIQNFSGANGNSDAGIYAIGGNDGLVVDDVVIKDNVGGSGIYANGPVDGVTITDSKIEGQTSSARGIVIWNGFKQNITITGNTLTNNNCCGIELQDGTASAVNISNNTIDIGIGDNGIGLTSLNDLTGPNLIDNNTITGGGRYGIEVKNPAGGVTVSNNTVTLTTQNADLRDRAGIAVFRRGFIAGQGYANIPNGVTVTGNTVTGYQQTSDSEGFGIVVEGINHQINNNTVTGNDVGIQRQAGHTPYTADAAGDGDQSNLADLYFGRGNSPVTCGVTITGNIFSGNGTDTRDVGNSDGAGFVVNTDSSKPFCTIQSAIDDVATINGHTLEVAAGTYDEQIVVNKELTINGVGATKPKVSFTGTGVGKKAIFDISADKVTINNFEMDVDLTKLSSGIVATSAGLDEITITNNIVNAKGSSNAASTGSYGLRNAISINYAAYRVATGGVDNITITDNIVTAVADDGFGVARTFRSGVSVDEGGGTYTNNDFTSINHDILIRFNSNGAILIDNNDFRGGGVQVGSHNAGGGQVDISNNTFDSPFANGYTSSLRLQYNNQGKQTNVTGNTFNNHNWGISLENYKSVTIDNNTFTPFSSSTTYRHITTNTKVIAGDTPPISQTAIGATFTNNTFNGSGSSGGIALAFYNHDDANDSYETFVIGSSGNENTFNNGIGSFITLGDETGPTSALAAAYGYSGIPSTTAACWSEDLDANFNKFDVGSGAKLSDDLTEAERTTLETKVFHKPDDACLAKVDYFLPIKNVTQSTAHATIQDAIDLATSGDVLEALSGTYNESVIVTKSVTILGPNAGISPNTGTRVDEAILVNSSIGRAFSIYNGNTDVIISGFKFDGGSPIHDGNETGFPNTSDVTFSKNLVVNANQIYAGTSTSWADLVITDNKFEDINATATSNAMQVSHTLTTTITDNTFTNVNYAAMAIDATPTVNISGNTIDGTGFQAIQLAGAVGDATVQNNKINDANRVAQAADRGAIRLYGSEFTGAVTISNNEITGGYNGITVRSGENITGKNITITENSITGLTDGKAIYHGGTGTLNATCNWFGTVDPAAIDAQVTGDVNFLPFGTNGTDDDLATLGFQPVVGSCDGFGPVRLYTDNTLSVLTSSHFNIQDAIDASSSGNAIVVDAGTYNESVIVTKSLTILGPNAGISPNTGTRVGEAILTNLPTGRAFSIQNGNTDVVISGFKFNGGSPIHDGNETGFPNTSDVTFSKNLVVNANNIYAGTSTSWADLLITDNKFEDVNASPTSSAMQVSHTLTTTITDNTFTNVNFAAILIDATPTVTISGNTIDGTGGQGIQLAGAVGDATVQNNKINDANRVAQAADRGAIRLYGSGYTGAVTISNNEITGGYNGITVRDGENITGKNITISENSITELTDGKAIYNGGTGTLNTTCNWFGVTSSQNVATKVSGVVAYTSWLVNGTDDDLTTIGFQPVAGGCTGSAIVIASVTTPAVICAVNSSATVTFSGGSASYDISWTDGGSNSGSASGITSPYTIADLLPATYTVTVSDANGSMTSEVNVVVSVFRIPAAPVITSDNSEVCKGTNAVLSGSCAVATDIFRWATPPINQGNVSSILPSSGTQIVTAPGVYTGYCESINGCVGPNGSITITEGTNCNGGGFIVVTPELPFICPGASIQLTAVGCATGTVSWTAVGGTVTGATVTLSPAATTTYIVNCSTGGSATTEVKVAQPNVTVTNNISTGKSVVKAVNTIESDKRVGSPNVTPAPNVIYEAGNSILLKPGFVAEGTAVFKAEIKVCN